MYIVVGKKLLTQEGVHDRVINSFYDNLELWNKNKKVFFKKHEKDNLERIIRKIKWKNN